MRVTFFNTDINLTGFWHFNDFDKLPYRFENSMLMVDVI